MVQGSGTPTEPVGPKPPKISAENVRLHVSEKVTYRPDTPTEHFGIFGALQQQLHAPLCPTGCPSTSFRSFGAKWRSSGILFFLSETPT